MAYKAKNPRKKRLRVKIEKCWYISIVDETDTEIDNDYCFLDRKEAVRAGNILKKNLEEVLAEKERLEKINSEARRVRQAVRKAVRDSEDAWDMMDGKAVACNESRIKVCDVYERDNESMRSVARNAVESVFFAMNDIGGAKCSQESSSESS